MLPFHANYRHDNLGGTCAHRSAASRRAYQPAPKSASLSTVNPRIRGGGHPGSEKAAAAATRFGVSHERRESPETSSLFFSYRIAERGGAVALFSALHEGWEWRASERRGKGISAQRRPWGERLRAGARFPPFPPRFLPSFRKSSRRVIVGSLVRGSIVGRPAAVPGRGGGGDGGCGAEALACVCVRAGLDEARLCVEIAMASCGARVLGTQMRGMPCRRGRVRSRPATNQSR